MAPATGNDAAAKRIAKLLRERRDAADAEFTLRMAFIMNKQKVADNAFFAAALRLHEAEVDLCRTRAERVEACEAHRKRMNEVYAATASLFKAGAIGRADNALATFYRIDAEIRLERAKAK